MEPYWSEANGHAPHSVKYESEAAVSSFPYCTESSLNFSTSGTAYSEDDAEYATGRRNKTSRQDPLSHRIIEKRRRDRMNSCLADLSRLIPPQYQRKGRGRIEKTEIIEMAIRHLKHLQSECMQKDNEYRLGYTDCMKEAAKFLYDSQMQDFCYRLIARLQEHCDELMKNDCFKSRNCHAADNVSASSGSPHQGYHSAPPLCQLRDMLGTSDIEHSNDHNDVKDLSFRNHLNQLQRNNLNGGGSTNGTTDPSVNSSSAASSSGQTNNNATASSSVISTTTITNNNNNGSSNNSNSTLSQQPHQAAVITSTAPASLNHHTDHTDSSNHDFDSSREPLLHTDTSNMHSPPPRDAVHHLHPLHHHQHNNHLNHHHHHPAESLLMQSSRMRNFSESSHDIEHNNNYKYKNHIKERFNHELHDEETSSEHCPVPPMLQSEHSHTHSMSDHSKDGTEPDVAPIIAKKRKLAVQSESDQATSDTVNDIIVRSSGTVSGRPPTTVALTSLLSSSSSTTGRIDEKPFCFSDIKTELTTSTVGSRAHQQHISGGVPSISTNTPPQQQQLASQPPQRSFAVPIFALHGQGTYYVPLNVDYSILIPFLNGMDLLEKNYTSMPVVHPININVNFMPTTPSASLLAAAAAAAAVAAGKQQPPPLAGNAAAAAAKAKLEAITNGW